MEVIGNKSVIYEFGGFILDPQERILFVDGVPIHLPAKEFDTLLLLVEHNGRALTKSEMLAAVWGDAHVEEGNLAKQISRLRKILDARGEARIETIPKHGYRFKANIKVKILEEAKPLVVERRTIKRLSVEFDETGPVSPRPAQLPAKRSFLTLARISIVALIVVIGFGLSAFLFRRNRATVVDPYEPVRLTDNSLDDTGPHWLRDGRIMFVRIYGDNHAETWVMQPDGSGQEPLKFADDRRVIEYSPDGKKMRFVKSGDETKIYLSNADGSGERLLPFRSGVFSSDSKMITYHGRVKGANLDIFTYSIDTGETKNVTNMETFEADPSFSPDGKRIVFASGRDGNAELYTINVDGTDLRRLTNNPGIDAHGAYSPDGTQILFGSVRENEQGDIYLARADGSGEPMKLTGWDKSNETAGPGSWSPDGTKIVFFTDRNGKDEIYVVSAEVFRPKLVLSDPGADLISPTISPDGRTLVYGAGLDDKSGEIRTYDLGSGRTSLVRKTEVYTAPRWSPDGKWIAYHDRINGNSEICLVRPDGTNFTNLTNDQVADTGPAWSPNGANIAFTSFRGDPNYIPRLFVMNVDGSDVHPLTPAKGWEGDPVFTQDGDSVIFSCDRGDLPGNMLDICEIGADGTREKRVLSHRSHDINPVLSPDGTRIAFTSMSDGNAEIYIMNRDGSGLLRLTRNTADDLGPEWSPDGNKLYFASNRDGRFAIYEITP